MTDTQPATFTGYAIVEILGHQRCSGYVETVAFGSVVMFKVVQTELPAQEQILQHNQYVNGEYIPGGSKVRVSRERAETYIGAASVYRMTPCTEEEVVKSQPVTIEVIERAGRLLPTVAWDDDDDPETDAVMAAAVEDQIDAWTVPHIGHDLGYEAEALAAQPVEVEPLYQPEPVAAEPRVSLAACIACAALAPGSYCEDHEPF